MDKFLLFYFIKKKKIIKNKFQTRFGEQWSKFNERTVGNLRSRLPQSLFKFIAGTSSAYNGFWAKIRVILRRCGSSQGRGAQRHYARRNGKIETTGCSGKTFFFFFLKINVQFVMYYTRVNENHV